MRRWIGVLCLLAWLATPVAWWVSQQPVPRETVLHQVGGRFWPIFSEDGRLFLCGDDEEIRVYDVIEGKRLNTLRRSIRDMVTPGPPYAGLAGFESGKALEIVDLITSKAVTTFFPGPAFPEHTYVAPNGRLAATDHGGLRLWDLNTGEKLVEIAAPVYATVSFSPDSKRMAVTDRTEDHVKIVDVSTLEIVVCPSSENRGIVTAAFAPDGRLIGLAQSSKDEWSLLDLTNDHLVVRSPVASSGFLGGGSHWYVGHTPLVRLVSIAESIGADQVAARWRNARSRRQVFDTNTGQMVGCIPYAPAQMLPDGKTMAIYDYGNDSVELWDMPPRTVVHPALAWTSLALAIGLTAWWWRARRKARAGSRMQTGTLPATG